MARSNGQGQAFARASAKSSTIMNCFGESLGFSRRFGGGGTFEGEGDGTYEGVHS
jgi:hypothetical protein